MLRCSQGYREEGPQHGKGNGPGTGDAAPKASMVILDRPPQELKFAAPEERTDVSLLLGRLAEQHLKVKRGGRQ